MDNWGNNMMKMVASMKVKVRHKVGMVAVVVVMIMPI